MSYTHYFYSSVKKILVFSAIALISSMSSLTLLMPSAVTAASIPYQAEVSPGAVALNKGENKLITLRFKNIGTQTWTRGQSKTAVYLYGSSSIFHHSGWITNDLAALINETSVKPGSMATASFYIQAPTTAGIYHERFLLSSGPNEWIKGSTVDVTFTVRSVSTPLDPSPSQAIKKPVETFPPSSLWRAELVNKGSIEWEAEPGKTFKVSLSFKNTGTQTWTRGGTNPLTVYTWNPKYRKSTFKDISWVNDGRLGSLVEAEVKPGQTGTVTFTLKAPSTSGVYDEVFQLAVENKAWVYGGTIPLAIQVTNPNDQTPDTPSPEVQASNNSTYNATLLLTSARNLAIAGNERVQLTHGFKNSGTAAWTSRGLRFVGVAPSLGAVSSLKDNSWISDTQVIKTAGATAPGEIGFINYTLKAPAKKGTYVASFQLTADDKDVIGGIIYIPVTVTNDGPVEPGTPPPAPIGVPPLNGDLASLPDEPIIRVGLFRTTDNQMIVRAVLGEFTVSQKGVMVCHFKASESATVAFDRVNHLYTLLGPNCNGQSKDYYVFRADDGISPLEITDYSRPIAWLAGSNDNKFRGSLELRFTPLTDTVWVMNELPIESYLKGIAETSNVSPLEYQKALLTAARTYALYHQMRGTKHANEFFHVDAHLDQVYRGYGQEARSPNIVDGVNATRGQIVTYEGKLAITPYFSRSDGRTRDWNEVWGGSGYPWLKSVPVPHDVGQTLWGHGVGLSARGALYMASKDGALYDAILKHFYTGIELRRAYK